MPRSRLLHVLFTLTAFAVVWLVTSRASANMTRSTNASFASFSPPAPLAPPASLVPVSLALPAPLPREAADANRAPLCDPRGATTFASAPQMQNVEVSLDSALTVDDCLTPSPGAAGHAAPGRAPLPSDASSASSDVAVVTAVAVLARCARELLPVPAASTPCPRPGFRSTVDRPPRA